MLRITPERLCSTLTPESPHGIRAVKCSVEIIPTICVTDGAGLAEQLAVMKRDISAPQDSRRD